MLCTSAGLEDGKEDVCVLFMWTSSVWTDVDATPPFPSVLQKVMAGAHTVPAGPLHAVPLHVG